MIQIQTEEEGETLREETLLEPWVRALALCHSLTVCSCTRDSPPFCVSLPKSGEREWKSLFPRLENRKRWSRWQAFESHEVLRSWVRLDSIFGGWEPQFVKSLPLEVSAKPGCWISMHLQCWVVAQDTPNDQLLRAMEHSLRHYWIKTCWLLPEDVNSQPYHMAGHRQKTERVWQLSGLATSKGSKKEGPIEFGTKGQHPQATCKEGRTGEHSEEACRISFLEIQSRTPDSAITPCSYPGLTAPVYEIVVTNSLRGNLSLHIKANFWSQVQ